MNNHVEEVPHSDCDQGEGWKVDEKEALLDKDKLCVGWQYVVSHVDDAEADRYDEESQVNASYGRQNGQEDEHDKDAENREKIQVLEALLSCGVLLDTLLHFLFII